MARVGMIVMLSPETCPPTDLAGPSCRASRRPSVATAVSPLAVKLEQHAAQGIAAALVVGGIDRPADHFAEEAGRHLVVLLLLEGQHVGKLVRVLRGELELAPLAADQHLPAVALQVEFLVGAFGEDFAEAVAGQDHAAGRFDGEARHLDADAHLQVGAHQDGPVRGDFELDVLQDRLGASRRGHAGGHLEGVQQFVAFAGRFHGLVLPFFYFLNQ